MSNRDTAATLEYHEATKHSERSASARRSMGRAGRRMVQEQFEWSRILDRWVNHYHHARDRVCAMV